tara:strand:+ start:2096 stop:2305 length:210 start_codon:yes stop_codon:yes gene_type:complete
MPSNIIDDPQTTLEYLGHLKAIAQSFRRQCWDKNYTSGITFNQVIKYLEEQEEIVEDSIPEWDQIMSEQ